jgi:hypothetical protein
MLCRISVCSIEAQSAAAKTPQAVPSWQGDDEVTAPSKI